MVTVNADCRTARPKNVPCLLVVYEKFQNICLLFSKCTTSLSYLPKNYGLMGLPEFSLNLKMKYSVPFLLVVVYEKSSEEPNLPSKKCTTSLSYWRKNVQWCPLWAIRSKHIICVYDYYCMHIADIPLQCWVWWAPQHETALHPIGKPGWKREHNQGFLSRRCCCLLAVRTQKTSDRDAGKGMPGRP